MINTVDTTTLKTFHLRYGLFLTDYKTRRYVIATIDTENYPVVFLHERFEEEIEDEIEDDAVKDDIVENDSLNSSFVGRRRRGSFYSVYSLYGADALTIEQANEVLDLLKARDSRKAMTKFKRYFNSNINSVKPYCEQVVEVVLDDKIPDEWYDAWKEMEFIITSSKDTTGYWECDEQERGKIF